MADRDTYDDTITPNVDDTAATPASGSHQAYSNHGIDGDNDHDPAKGGAIGAVGGAVVGALAGGPIGAVIGAVAGGLSSAGGVAVVDRHDHDNSPADSTLAGETSARFIGNDDAASTAGYTAPVAADATYNDAAAPRAGYDTAAGSSYVAGSNSNSNSAIDGTVIPVVEEQLEVGKRQVQTGGVRVTQTVEEVPVSEQVKLHEEHVTIDRRPVDRAVGADLGNAFQEGTYEVIETAEVPVVAKTARVVEEVVIGKIATDRTETVNDSVRRTDVEVEQIPGSTPATAADYRSDMNR